MAKHRRHHRRRHNPMGVSSGLVKDVAFNAAGLAGANFGASFLGQSGWLNVGATLGAALAASWIGKAVVGAPAAEEILKGGILATLIAATKQSGVSIPGLSSYVPNYFSAPTSSDPYGRATAPTIMLPAPSGKGGSGMSGNRYRSRFAGKF
jgi:hypothetical protein